MEAQACSGPQRPQVGAGGTARKSRAGPPEPWPSLRVAPTSGALSAHATWRTTRGQASDGWVAAPGWRTPPARGRGNRGGGGSPPAKTVGQRPATGGARAARWNRAMRARPGRAAPRRVADWSTPTGAPPGPACLDTGVPAAAPGEGLGAGARAPGQRRRARGRPLRRGLGCPPSGARTVISLDRYGQDRSRRRASRGRVARGGRPTSAERVCQHARLTRWAARVEPGFDEASCGDRRGRSPPDARRTGGQAIQAAGRAWRVDADLQDCWGSVDHTTRRLLVPPRVADGQGRRLPQARGTPQGGVLSPRLRTIRLRPLAQEMRRRGDRLTRDAEDGGVPCQAAEAARAGRATAPAAAAARACPARMRVSGGPAPARQATPVATGQDPPGGPTGGVVRFAAGASTPALQGSGPPAAPATRAAHAPGVARGGQPGLAGWGP